METPKIKIGSKTYTAKKPMAKMWRRLVKYRRDFGDPEKLMTDADAEIEAIDELYSILADLLPDEITADVLEEQTDLETLVDFSVQAMVWVELIIMGKAKEIPAKNAGKAEK